jgi:hypothetical protein
MTRIILDVLVIAAAVIAFVASFDAALQAKRYSDRVLFWCQMGCSVLLLLCQTSWLMTSLAGLGVSPDATNYAWDAFNLAVAITFIAAAWSRSFR